MIYPICVTMYKAQITVRDKSMSEHEWRSSGKPAKGKPLLITWLPNHYADMVAAWLNSGKHNVATPTVSKGRICIPCFSLYAAGMTSATIIMHLYRIEGLYNLSKCHTTSMPRQYHMGIHKHHYFFTQTQLINTYSFLGYPCLHYVDTIWEYACQHMALTRLPYCANGACHSVARWHRCVFPFIIHGHTTLYASLSSLLLSFYSPRFPAACLPIIYKPWVCPITLIILYTCPSLLVARQQVCHAVVYSVCKKVRWLITS
jgi:hypothetical protein